MSAKKLRAEKEQSSEPPSSLPEDVIIDILARVPRCNYPTLSLVSKHFRSLVASREIYARRSLLGCTEHCLYVVLTNEDSGDHQLYILRRKANGNHRFILIPSLPSMHDSGCYVAMSSKIYVFNNTTSLVIDCISHTAQPLPSMPVLMEVRMADIIDGRIYVIGKITSKDTRMAVFNTETQTWEPETIKVETEAKMWRWECVVMAGKMYFSDRENSNVYEPKGRKWETDEMVNGKEWENACVVDDVLYYYDDYKDKIRAYDSEKKSWGVVKGVEELYDMVNPGWWKTASYGGKLFLFRDEDSYVGVTYFAEISLERNKKGRFGVKLNGWMGLRLICMLML
ncbi:unnamed protein product [Microthlaspi erraticum]|uniref:F-box domain-containing protein n=1 Tax=Microthlaspi erraticum TaxID=1685480 RepID=A0A6D2HL74_9BRAS|nr:unnamed protein product [Microthlaspi erraticum]